MKVVITDSEFPQLEQEKAVFAQAGFELVIARCKTAADVIAIAADADGLLVHWAPITREVSAALRRCRVIVRYGIGVDNIDLAAAAEHGIAVCNVPDYATGEVADHTLALALALARQTGLIDQRLRSGLWKIVPDSAMPSFRDSRFTLLGFGKIAREVARRAQAFGFEVAAHDPFVSAPVLSAAGVTPLTLDAAIATADILSLHLPLNEKTRHLINATTLARMKRNAILVNTSRGALIDSAALATALAAGTIFAAGLDVHEQEPLPPAHPIFRAPRTLLTSHVAWFSDQSAPRLQRMAAEEVTRGVLGQPLRSQINRTLCLPSVAK